MKARRRELVIPPSMYAQLREFLRSRNADGREAFATLLCGRRKTRNGRQLLARHLFLPEDDCFLRRSSTHLELHREYDLLLLEAAKSEDLVPVQVHTHPGTGTPSFSGVDDASEKARAKALQSEFGLHLGSVVFDKTVENWSARIWTNGAPRLLSLETPGVNDDDSREGGRDLRFDRQVDAFGPAFQARLSKLQVGIVGVGGIGSILVGLLSHLGIKSFVLVDPDKVEKSNLNRLQGATLQDARTRTAKTEVARRQVYALHEQQARVTEWALDVQNPQVMKSLGGCDVIFAATDNHSSRLVAQKTALAYHKRFVNVGIRLDAKKGEVERILGRVTIPPIGGGWCLYCEGIIDPETASMEMADSEHRELLQRRGYLPDTPAPAVMWANSNIASLAVSAFHDSIFPFRPRQEVEVQDSRDLIVDMMDLETVQYDHSDSSSTCVVCSPSGIVGLGDQVLNKTRHDLPTLPGLFKSA